MSLYDREREAMLATWGKAVADHYFKGLDPLEFYWRRGIMSLREWKLKNSS